MLNHKSLATSFMGKITTKTEKYVLLTCDKQELEKIIAITQELPRNRSHPARAQSSGLARTFVIVPISLGKSSVSPDYLHPRRPRGSKSGGRDFRGRNFLTETFAHENPFHPTNYIILNV